MTPESLAFLATEDGVELLHYAATLDKDRLTRLQALRKRTTPEIAASAVSLLELRQRARTKFLDAETLFFTQEGYEQASSAAVAEWRAAQFPAVMNLLDACCGVGSDASAFADSRRVLAIDADPTTATCAALNLSGKENARVVCADVTLLDLPHLARNGIRAAFFDPSRRVTDTFGKRVRAASSDDYSPPLSYFAHLAENFPAAAAKVSPVLSDETLKSLDVSVEFVSHRGECKEAVLWSAAFGRVPLPIFAPEPRYSATLLANEGTTHTLTANGVPLSPASLPLAFLIEPDPAIIRAHLVPELAEMLAAAPLDPTVAYLTAERASLTPFGDIYAIHETCTMDKKEIQRVLRRLGGKLTAIKKRGVEADPEVWRKQIKDAGDSPFVLVLARSQGKGIALFCTPNLSESSSF